MAERSTLALRAAQWYGAASDPRTSIKVGRHQVILVVPRGRSRLLVNYSEDSGGRNPRASFALLEPDKTRALVEALR